MKDSEILKIIKNYKEDFNIKVYQKEKIDQKVNENEDGKKFQEELKESKISKVYVYLDTSKSTDFPREKATKAFKIVNRLFEEVGKELKTDYK